MATQHNSTQFDGAALPRVFIVDGNGNSQVPEQLHPGNIDYASFGDNAALKRASDTLALAWDKLAALDLLRASPHPLDRPAAHARKVGATLDEFDDGWAGAWDGAKAALKAEQGRVDAELVATSGLKSNPVHFDAITAAFHGMKPEQRASTLSDLIRQGDNASLATLLEAPLFLTGLTAEQRGGIKRQVFNKANPEGLAPSEQLAKSLNKLETASLTCLNARMKLRNGTDRYENKIKAAEQLANGVRTGFTAN